MATICAAEGRGTRLSERISQDYRQASLASSAYVMNTVQPYEITSLSDSNEVAALLFSDKPSLEWSLFKGAVALHLRAKEEDIEELRSILVEADPNVVSVSQFKKVLKWFFPLVPEANLRSSGTNNSFVWRVSSIADLLRQQWFHGFAPDAQKRLRLAPAGTFLVRFGCQAPHFILMMKDENGSCVEWRVLSMSGSVRLVDAERFMNLQQLVENYSHVVPEGASCPIEFPCSRLFSKHCIDR